MNCIESDLSQRWSSSYLLIDIYEIGRDEIRMLMWQEWIRWWQLDLRHRSRLIPSMWRSSLTGSRTLERPQSGAQICRLECKLLITYAKCLNVLR
jgi:hypothetical protein